MQAITVKYLKPTATKPARLVAQAHCKARIVEAYSYADMAFQATLMAHKLVHKLDWAYSDNTGRSNWIRGDLADGSYVFVCEA